MSLDAAQHRSGKGSGDENFPVASWVVAQPFRRPILSFYEFVRIADDISDHPAMPPDDKLAHLNSLEGSLLGHNRVLHKLNSSGLLTRMLYGKRPMLAVRNLVSCETHREAIETIFNERLV